jgi:putative acetyltransferase
MSAQAIPQFALRPYLPEDAPMLAEIFRASVEELTEDDYNPAQQEAWAALADDTEELAARLGKHLTLIATMNGSPVGFISLDKPTEIGLFYVHPAVAGHGAGKLLYEAIEKISASRGTKQLTVDASDTAREFFTRRGFTAEQRNTVSVGNEWLSNTTMKKVLAANDAAKGRAP